MAYVKVGNTTGVKNAAFDKAVKVLSFFGDFTTKRAASGGYYVWYTYEMCSVTVTNDGNIGAYGSQQPDESTAILVAAESLKNADIVSKLALTGAPKDSVDEEYRWDGETFIRLN